MKKSKIEYYDGKEEHGIIYDWDMIRREYHKLVKVGDIYDPTTAPIENCGWSVLMSIRSTGKTSGWLLMGLIARQHYGTKIIYVRHTEDEIMPKFALEALKVIRDYKNGYYIRQLTNDKYNSLHYHARRTYYCLRDEDGRIIEEDPEPFMTSVSIDHSEELKSNLNEPKGDIVLVDEFIRQHTDPDAFVDLCQILSSIVRFRKSMRIICLANNTNVNHPFFREWGVSQEVRNLKEGQYKICTTTKGTKLYIELIGLKPSRIRQEVNTLYFGFDNPKLASIQGGISWAFDNVPHIHTSDTDVYLYRGLHMDINDQYLRIDFVHTEDRGLIANVMPAKKSEKHKDTLVFTLGEVWDRRTIYGWGTYPVCRRFWELYKLNKVYYADNETGSLVEDYVRQCRLKRL